MKNIRDFYLKILSFLEVKFSMYLYRRVFVMHRIKPHHIKIFLALSYVTTLFQTSLRMHTDWLLSRGWGCNLRVILIRVCEPVFQNLPHSHTWPLKKRTIHIPDHPKCWPIHILPFDFLYPFFAGCHTNISQSIHIIQRGKATSKNLWAKNMCINQDVRKMGPFI